VVKCRGTWAGMVSDVRMLVGEGHDVIEQMVTRLGKFAELSNAG
jgi:hypothetical protein